jgi:hypothetical protein
LLEQQANWLIFSKRDTKMLLTFIFFMQAQPQPPQKVSWLLWTTGIFFFLLGLSLLIFLIRQRKQLGGGDEPELKKLILDEAAVEPRAVQTQSLVDSEPEPEVPLAEPDVLFSMSKNFPDDQEAPTAFERPLDEPAPETFAVPDETENAVEPAASSTADQLIEEQTEERLYRPPVDEERIFKPAAEQVKDAEETVFKMSSPSKSVAENPPLIFSQKHAEPPVEEQPVVEEISDELPVIESQTSTLASSPQSFTTQADGEEDSGTTPLVSQADTARSVRLEEPPSVQNFEQANTSSREPFEPPRIEPLVPQNQQPETGQFTTSRPTKISTPLPARETRLDREALTPFADEAPRTHPTPITTPEREPVTTRVAEPAWQGSQAGRKVAGAVLGLPVEATDAPLVLGKPVIAEDEIGVTGFRNYGKAPDASDTGRGGLITLLVVLLLIGGGVAAYFKVPSFHWRVDALLLRLRGGAAPVTTTDKPRAQIIPSRNPEVNKNIVKAKGAVLNISEETLEDLAIEVSFYRGEKVIETRNVAVTPATLSPGTQGSYEFEYDGSKSNGFALYSVTKLTSKGGEVKFTSAKQ